MAFFGVELNAQVNRLLLTVRLTLAKNKYMPNFRTIYKSFIKNDPQQTGLVSKTHFDRALNENGIFLKKFEIQVFEKAFDKDGQIDWFGFLGLLREPLNSYRVQVIDYVFKSLDSGSVGKIHESQLMSKFDPSDINEFKLGFKTGDQICMELLSLVPLTADGCITREEFFNFYTDLGINMPGDQIFAKFVCSMWNCPLPVIQKTEKEELKESIRLIRFKLIQRTEGTHEEFILRKIFNEFDPNKQGYLAEEELATMLLKLEIPTETRLVHSVLEKMDHNRDGRIEFEEFKNFLFFDPYPI